MSNERIIAEYFSEKYPLDQLKGSMYLGSDIYYQIPHLIFRFSLNLDERIYDELRECIESFEGQLRWTEFKGFFSKRVFNHVICPMRYYEKSKYAFENNAPMSDTEYFSEEEYKELCEKGVMDIPLLFEHLKKNFNPNLEAYWKGNEELLKNFDWNNPNCESTYGTTFNDHGSHHQMKYATDKARENKKQFGQWTNDQQAADFIAQIAKEKGIGTHDIPLPNKFPSRVFLSNGIQAQADMVRVIVNPDGSVQTAYPFSSRHPY